MYAADKGVGAGAGVGIVDPMVEDERASDGGRCLVVLVMPLPVVEAYSFLICEKSVPVWTYPIPEGVCVYDG